MPRKVPVLAGTALAIGALALGALPAAAGEPSPPPPAAVGPVPEIAPGMLKAVSRDLGISAEDARTRITNEQRAVPLEKSLREQLGSRYGGAWVTGPTARLVVATTDLSDTANIVAAGADAALVPHSLAELDAAKSALDRSAGTRSRAQRGASVWSVDVRSNSVVVRAGEPAAAKAFLARSGASTELVRVTRSAERPRTYAEDLRGGDAYYINGATRCSIGFSVTQGSREGFITAGHCGDAGALTTGHNRAAQGTVRAASFPGNDYAWVEVNSNWIARPYVKGPGSANVTVSGSQQVPVGSSVCRSGSTSGWRCGTIEQHDVTITYQEGTVRGLTRSSVCAEPGDSGGSFISGSQAQGTTSGGSGDCS
ncbi:MAG: S1 family peptidase, partial [Streptomyces sp.]|uniref:S1 family peptidase n=1 Tax=Streptomyces sp. TaxID=1931 RepID=UPI003D6B4F17